MDDRRGSNTLGWAVCSCHESGTASLPANIAKRNRVRVRPAVWTPSLSRATLRGMRQLFKSWRAKLGCLLMGIAFGITVCWFRSYLVGDLFTVPCREQALSLESNNGALRWTRLTPLVPQLVVTRLRWETTRVRRSGPDDRHHLSDYWTWAGFTYNAGPFYGYGTEVRLELIAVPYWAAVLPLTLLSGWLVLGRRGIQEWRRFQAAFRRSQRAFY